MGEKLILGYWKKKTHTQRDREKKVTPEHRRKYRSISLRLSSQAAYLSQLFIE
jgi:hypothetical protein